MQKLLLLATFFLSISSFKTKDNEQGKVEAVFNRQLDFNAVVKMKLDLSERGIVVTYKSLAFDENGKLKSIDFSVDCKDGFVGGAKAENLTNQSHFGFYRDYSETAASPFGAGNF